jgi:hypothetical protein
MKQTRLSKFGKVVIVAAVLITLGAMTLLVAAQSTWPFDYDPMTWDANDPGMASPPYNPSDELGIYYMDTDGFDLPIKTVASNPDLRYYVEILDPDGNPVAEQYVGGTSGDPEQPSEYTIQIPHGLLGQYRIRTKNGDITDRFMVRDSSEIPEFSTIAIPVAAILGLALYFQRRRFRNN